MWPHRPFGPRTVAQIEGTWLGLVALTVSALIIQPSFSFLVSAVRVGLLGPEQRSFYWQACKSCESLSAAHQRTAEVQRFSWHSFARLSLRFSDCGLRAVQRLDPCEDQASFASEDSHRHHTWQRGFFSWRERFTMHSFLLTMTTRPNDERIEARSERGFVEGGIAPHSYHRPARFTVAARTSDAGAADADLLL